jgi:S1-C subfamily serine protease
MANVNGTGSASAGPVPAPLHAASLTVPHAAGPPARGSRATGAHAPRSQPHYGRRRFAAGLAVVGLLAIPATIGYELAHGNGSSASPSAAAVLPVSFGVSQSSSPSSTGGSLDASAIAHKVDGSVVNINTTLSSGGQAAGTGIIVSSSGLVLTNNHVIADSTSLQVEIGGNGTEHPAKVLGYDVADDVALIQVQNVSGLTAAPIGAASSLSVGDPIVAIGNAGGQGGTPTVVTGSVTALNQQITASDQDGSNPETLQHLVEVDADIQPGDSGGPLVNPGGQVVGMDAAASSGNGGFGFSGQSASQGYAIPIENALSIATKIVTGDGSTNVHLGANRGLLGVEIQPDSGASSSGAVVSGVQSGSGAAQAGIAQGDVITGIDGKSIDSASALTHAMATYSPKDTVQITWTDSSGSTRHTSVHLSSGPPA